MESSGKSSRQAGGPCWRQVCSVTLQSGASCWASVKDWPEEETCLPQARASGPPPKHPGAPGTRGASLLLLGPALGPGDLRKEIVINQQHSHHQTQVGGKGMLCRSASSHSLTLQAPSQCLAMPQTPWERLLREARLPARAHIGSDLPCLRSVLLTMWVHHAAN